MAEADCDLCKDLGYRSCDQCGQPVFEPTAFGPDLCGYCR